MALLSQLGSQFDAGIFDLSVAVSLFNYMSISDMIKTIEEVFTLLKPGAHFIFSVPHPFTPDASDGKYFALRDKSYNSALHQR
jgi:SAM-dependent methyltransferase